MKWSLGQIVTINQGAVEQGRVTTVKTCIGVFKRAVQYVCPLPFQGKVNPTKIKGLNVFLFSIYLYLFIFWDVSYTDKEDRFWVVSWE